MRTARMINGIVAATRSAALKRHKLMYHPIVFEQINTARIDQWQ
jgi:hypothetical protein